MTQKPNVCISPLIFPILVIVQLNGYNAVFSIVTAQMNNLTSHNKPCLIEEMPGKGGFSSTKDNHMMENNTKYFENGDTITQNDAVRIQYGSLPYPPVTEKYMRDEEHHYNTAERGAPFYTMPSIKLDNLNNFLYQGSQAFR